MHTDLHSKWHKTEFKSLPLHVTMHCLDFNKETHVRSTELLIWDLKIMTNTIQTGWVGLTFTTFMNLWNQDVFPWQHLGQGTSEHSWSNTAYQQHVQCTVGWERTLVGLDTLEKTKISCYCWGLSHVSSAIPYTH